MRLPCLLPSSQVNVSYPDLELAPILTQTQVILSVITSPKPTPSTGSMSENTQDISNRDSVTEDHGSVLSSEAAVIRGQHDASLLEAREIQDGLWGFRKLPAEIREMIWEFALLEPRVVEIYRSPKMSPSINLSERFKSRTPLPVTLQVCQESRQQALKKYKAFPLFFDLQAYFNPAMDTLLVSFSMHEHDMEPVVVDLTLLIERHPIRHLCITFDDDTPTTNDLYIENVILGLCSVGKPNSFALAYDNEGVEDTFSRETVIEELHSHAAKVKGQKIMDDAMTVPWLAIPNYGQFVDNPQTMSHEEREEVIARLKELDETLPTLKIMAVRRI